MKYKPKKPAPGGAVVEPEVSSPPAPPVVPDVVASISEPVNKVLFPFIPAGEWREILGDTTGVCVVTLDTGAFMWIWDLVETRARVLVEYATKPGVSEPFQQSALSVTARAIDAFRDEASRHPGLHRVQKVAPEKKPPTVKRQAKNGQAVASNGKVKKPAKAPKVVRFKHKK